jgi:hypothetical protein
MQLGRQLVGVAAGCLRDVHGFGQLALSKHFVALQLALRHRNNSMRPMDHIQRGRRRGPRACRSEILDVAADSAVLSASSRDRTSDKAACAPLSAHRNLATQRSAQTSSWSARCHGSSSSSSSTSATRRGGDCDSDGVCSRDVAERRALSVRACATAN